MCSFDFNLHKQRGQGLIKENIEDIHHDIVNFYIKILLFLPIKETGNTFNCNRMQSSRSLSLHILSKNKWSHDMCHQMLIRANQNKMSLFLNYPTPSGSALKQDVFTFIFTTWSTCHIQVKKAAAPNLKNLNKSSSLWQIDIH